MSEYRYKAFVSYSHRDREWGAWLHRALERYRVPKRLVGSRGEFGPVPARLAPVFRDREDLSSSADLTGKVKESLQAAESLVVVCSPDAAQSRWVNEEIAYFQSLGRTDRVFALIVDGDPQAPDPAQQCFPTALTVDPDGTPREPLAADARKWADGKLLAKLKLVAGILGIRLDDLRRRDMQRRQRLWLMAMGGALSIALVMSVLAVLAVTARQAAENRREHAEKLVGYMVGDLKSKLDEVGRLDILQGMGGQVAEYLQSLDPDEVTDESLVQQAQVWRQLGQVSMDQNKLQHALEAFAGSRDVLAELHRRNPGAAQYVYELGNAEFWVGYVYLETGDFDRAENAFYDYLAWSYRLNELEPGNAEWLMEKSYAHSNIAALINRRGSAEVEQALLHIEEAVRFNREVIALAPGEPAYEGELAETMAWLADTQMLSCNLGAALKSRQENVELARRQTGRAPANVTYRSRYAFALSGLAGISRQVGLLDAAERANRESTDILGRLVELEPSNLSYRSGFLLREVYQSSLLSETGRETEARVQLEEIEEALRDLIDASGQPSPEQRSDWVDYLLIRAELDWRLGDTAAAQGHLAEAVFELERQLRNGGGGASMWSNLASARFLWWQQQGSDLFSDPRFAALRDREAVGANGCTAQANRVKQAILTGDAQRAAELTQQLLAKGYYEPAFLRVCTQYGLCDGGG
jgi:tetratricopeptide (TPR) repeat protein